MILTNVSRQLLSKSRACGNSSYNLLCRKYAVTRKDNVERKVVLVSKSNNIFENLALEEWLYENEDLSHTSFLLFWKNKPAIVCGRHQNPWLEADIKKALSEDVDIARRSSGGGTVFHDEGNLNLSFLKARDRYNRKQNLHLVVDAITDHWNLDLVVNDRDDIMMDGFYKISGTAAKLGRLSSYHHFTLLYDVDQSLLRDLLLSPMVGTDSRSTKSFPAAVMNLRDRAPDMTFQLLVEVIGRRFLQGTRHLDTQTSFELVDPVAESQFPGITDIVQRLQTWEWVYGKTPKFTIKRTFSNADKKLKSAAQIQVEITFEKGELSFLSLSSDVKDLHSNLNLVQSFIMENFSRMKLSTDNVNVLLKHLSALSETSDKHNCDESITWIIQCLQSCFHFL